MSGAREVAWRAEAGGKVSTTASGKRVWSAALEAAGVSSAGVTGEKDWRHQYCGPVVALADAMVASPEAAHRAATAGLDALYAEFVYGEKPLKEAMMEAPSSEADLGTATVRGSGPVQSVRMDLGALEACAARGSAERSAVAHCRAVAPEGELRGLPEEMASTVFVILGATAEMGPARALLDLGAAVVAVCRGGQRWADLAAYAEASAGALYAPLGPGRTAVGEAGADVLADAPALARWLAGEAFAQFDRLCIGSYIYLDGEAHVRAAVACDAIAMRVAEVRSRGVDLAYLASPGTAYPVDEDAVRACQRRFDEAPMWQSMLGGASLLGGGRGYVPNARAPVAATGGGSPKYVTNGLSIVQGPNYCLAKTLQNWRCVAAQRTTTMKVSANMAPPSRTASMTGKNATVARWLEGVAKFEPYETFDPAFVQPIMTALLLYDLAHGAEATHDNPMDLLWDGAFHGGAPRCAFLGDSIASSAVVVSFFS